MSYTNERLQAIIETSGALIEANNTNETAQEELATAQVAAENAQEDVDRLTTLLDNLVNPVPEPPEEPVGETSRSRAKRVLAKHR